MTTPSPFMVAREASNNLGSAFARVKDENAIEKILSEAMGSGSPEALQNSIGKILSQVSPERQGLAVQYLQSSFNNIKEKQERERKQILEKQAAEQGGYTYGAPAQVQAQQVKNQAPPKPSKPLGGISGQPIPQEISDAVSNVLSNNQNASADELALAFDREKVPRTYSNSYIENRRRQDETKASNEREDKKTSRSEELAFHKESEAYDQDLLKQTKAAKNQISALENIQNAIKSGNVTPSSVANIFKGFGKIGEKISEALINADQATLLTSIPQLLEGWKDVFGVRLSDADLRVLQDKLPSIGKSPDANNAIIKILRKYADMTLLRSQIAEEIKTANKGLRPLGFASKVEQHFDEMTAPIKIINPNTGKEIEIPAYKLSDALKAGARLANE